MLLLDPCNAQFALKLLLEPPEYRNFDLHAFQQHLHYETFPGHALGYPLSLAVQARSPPLYFSVLETLQKMTPWVLLPSKEASIALTSPPRRNSGRNDPADELSIPKATVFELLDAILQTSITSLH